MRRSPQLQLSHACVQTHKVFWSTLFGLPHHALHYAHLEKSSTLVSHHQPGECPTLQLLLYMGNIIVQELILGKNSQTPNNGTGNTQSVERPRKARSTGPILTHFEHLPDTLTKTCFWWVVMVCATQATKICKFKTSPPSLYPQSFIFETVPTWRS